MIYIKMIKLDDFKTLLHQIILVSIFRCILKLMIFKID